MVDISTLVYGKTVVLVSLSVYVILTCWKKQ